MPGCNSVLRAWLVQSKPGEPVRREKSLAEDERRRVVRFSGGKSDDLREKRN